ncbi:conserved hypothetical protein [Pediculus humanus corporis]|uniref:Uncharacterized protein n=1 Tax=Pediculus humanus subsp. corporis TaxID=121224 RepID=E0VQA2_PEDHC|nr:uncharacterized protein Phum_PHUM375060 [Pediculus humanus corporis]EEB15558.1 conserved hypothetical protein [Pediculus humanus corporis]
MEFNNSTISNEFKNLNSRTDRTILSRRKRYIVFPKGSSFQLVLESLSRIPRQMPLVLGPTIQLAWPLPSGIPQTSRKIRSTINNEENFIYEKKSSFTKNNHNKKYDKFGNVMKLFTLFGITVGLAWQLPDDPAIFADHKKKHKIYKRNVLKKMETVMEPMGTNGQQCVLKALCESGQRTPSKKEFIVEIFHKIFSVNHDDDDDDNDTHDDKMYKRAHRSINQNCDKLYPECPFSIFKSLQ